MHKFFFALIITTLFSCSSNDCHLESIEVQTLELKIKKRKLAKIDSLRNIVIETGNADQVKKKFKAKLDGSKVSIRLKGDQYDHYDTDQFSLRITNKTDSGKFVYSIQHPKTRRNINEWIFHQLLKENGIAHLDYQFIHVKLNKKNNGTYAKEEHLKNKGLLTSKGFEEGIILKFDDDKFWDDGLPEERNKAYDTKHYQEAEIKSYSTCNDPKDNKLAIQLLKGFQSGKLKAEKVFDIQALSKFYALCDLSGSRHALRWINLVFHYNPKTKKLMPLGFDSNSMNSKMVMIQEDYINQAHHARLFENIEFQQNYHKELKRLSNETYLNQFLKKRKCELVKYESMIQENQWTYSNDFDYLFDNQEIIKEYLKSL